MPLSQQQKNKLAFERMLEIKRKNLTGAEFVSLYNRKYARIDPYSYKEEAPTRMNHAVSGNKVRVKYQGRCFPSLYSKVKPAGLISCRHRFDFFGSRRHLTRDQRQWQDSLRSYPKF